MKLSDYVIKFLEDRGVNHIFVLPGGAAMHLNDSLARSKIKHTSLLHEQCCAIAAEAYSRVTNDIAVCMVTAGPGSTNTITGVFAAWTDSTPVIFISGQVKSQDLKRPEQRQNGTQEVDIVSIVAPITKYAVTVTNPTTIRYHLEKAYRAARFGRPGPVWIDIPLDIQCADIPEELFPWTPPFHALWDSQEQIKKVTSMLKQAKKPVILAGNGIRQARGIENFLNVIDMLDIPVLTTWPGMDLLPEANMMNFGRPGAIAPRYSNFILQNCDLILILGARMDMATIGYNVKGFAPKAKKIMVNIDPSEIGKLNGAIDLPIIADCNDFLQCLINNIDPDKIQHHDWIIQCIKWKKQYPLPTIKENGLSMYEFSQALSDCMPEGQLIVPGSSGFASEIFLLNLQVKQGQRVFHNRGTGSMGFAIPAAIGACIASGGKSVVSVDGDGGFQMNIQELSVIKEMNLPIKFFVINNGGYASIRSCQNNYFKENHIGCDEQSGLYLPKLERQANAYGINYTRISDTEWINELIKDERPRICEVMVLPDEERVPRLSSKINSAGNMESRPLEDLYPFLPEEELKEIMK